MQRSWAYLFYDAALIAVLLLPLALGSALVNDRDSAAVVYRLSLAGFILASLLVARSSNLSLRAYWVSLTDDTAR